MKMQGIFLSWIVVKDLKAAIKFYTEIVGLELKNVSEELGWAELSGPHGTMLGIAQENPKEKVKAGSNAVVTISVDNIVSAKEEIAKKGARLLGDVIEVPGEVKLQTFVDSDGNMLQLVELIRKH